MNTIESILNDIDELLEDSWSLPLSGGRCVVDAEKVRDLIDSIRMNMPAEIKQARAVVADRNQILSGQGRGGSIDPQGGGTGQAAAGAGEHRAAGQC